MLVLPAIVLASFSLGCDRFKPTQSDIGAVKVAKVDTDYVFESNVDKYVNDYRESRRARFSPFVGFSPDEILRVREDAIDNEIRDHLKRLPGVQVSQAEVTKLANDDVEALAWKLYRMITQNGADFATVAMDFSQGMSARGGGVIEPFEVVHNPEPYQSAAYSMKKGDISEPFSSWDGWRIIRLEDITEDPLLGKSYHIRMIWLKSDTTAAEAEILDRIAKNHTIEVLDPKYNSRRALAGKDFQTALTSADAALGRDKNDSLAHYLKARALWGLNRQDDALAELQQAADTSIPSDTLIPYYYFDRGQYLQLMGRADDAKQAYRKSFDTWRQDISLAVDLQKKFQELNDQEYLSQIQTEIDAIAKQDANALAFGSEHRGSEGVIITGEGQYHGGSAVYQPGYDTGDSQ